MNGKGQVVRSSSFNHLRLHEVAMEHHYDIPGNIDRVHSTLPRLKPAAQQNIASEERRVSAPPPLPPRDNTKCSDSTVLASNVASSKYNSSLPLKLIVSRGVYGMDRCDTFYEGDELVAHFVRQVAHVTVEEASGNLYKIPVSSSLHFGLVYNPEKNTSLALKGYVFRSVEDVLGLKKMPKLLIALKGWRGKDPLYTVEDGDVLWVKGDCQDSKSTKHKFLKCIQANTGLEKFLRSDSCLPLSTKPSLLLLPLIKLISHAPPPIQCVIDCQQDSSRGLPAGLKGFSPVILHECTHDTSLIATRKESPGIIEIPTNSDLDFTIAKTTDLEKDQMRMEAAGLFVSFDGKEVDQSLFVQSIGAKMKNKSSVQHMVLQMVDKENAKKTQHLLAPPGIQNLLPTSVSASNTKKQLIGSKKPALSTPPTGAATNKRSSVENRLQAVEQEAQLLISEVKTVKEQFLTLKSVPIFQISKELEETKTLASNAFDQIPGITCLR